MRIAAFSPILACAISCMTSVCQAAEPSGGRRAAASVAIAERPVDNGYWRPAPIMPLAFASAAVQAEDWREFRRSDRLVGALNVDGATREGSIDEVAMLLVPKAQPLAPVLTYTIVDLRADCDARTVQFLGSQTFAGSVATGDRTPPDAAPARSEGERLDPLCAVGTLKGPGAPTALEFAGRAWNSR